MENENPIQPQSPEISSDPGPKRSQKWLGIAGGVLVLILIAAGAWYLKKNLPSNNQNQQTGNQTPAPAPTPTGQIPSEPLVSGSIEWHYPKNSYLDLIKTGADTSYGGPTFQEVGVFKSGQYQGKALIVAQIPCAGPCPMMIVRMVADAPGSATSSKPVALKNYSDPLDNINTDMVDTSKFSIDTDTKISDLDAPASVTDSDAKTNLSIATLSGFTPSYNLFNVTNLKPVFVDPKVGQVYTTPDDPSKVDSFFGTNGFYVKMPDWNTAVYRYSAEFVGSDNIPKVTWSNNVQNTDQYQYVTIGGCGFSNYGAVVSPDQAKLTDLKVVGKTSTGQSVYEFTDPNAQLLKDMYANDYHPYNTTTYQDDPSAKVPYDQFVAAHPMFFWVDPFGRLIQFKNTKFVISNAECGKPVIYLYPTKSENVSVKLTPTGGFTYTEPDYVNGWNVFATPNGLLTNLSDGKTYPYLFWEGRSNDIYQIPDKGFVVARSGVHNFLTDKLAQLGLNTKETSDFQAYWEPYMQSAPYYFVTFMGNSVMDQIAPLSISPKPDTIIRILMDFRPLDKPISVQGFKIQTPVRQGFTVVEWGGVKH